MKFPLDKFRTCVIIQRLFDSITEFGGIAQLGERLNGIQEVSGSIPLISTTKSPEFFGIQDFFLLVSNDFIVFWASFFPSSLCMLNL